jgi:arabinogalactan endo-1,4-beta-galactosidase
MEYNPRNMTLQEALLWRIVGMCATIIAAAGILYGQEAGGFLRGADLSSLTQIEAAQGTFRDHGVQRSALDILRDHGVNVIRLKLWHTPMDGHNSLQEVLAMGARVKRAGMKLLLDIHYSDTWADPSAQTKPAAWKNLTFSLLQDSVYRYTKDVVTSLRAANALPDIIQIGNEISQGMLWDDGKLNPGTTLQWQSFCLLLKSGIQGAKDALATGDSVKIMIHIDRGGDNGGCRWFFDNLLAQAVPLDYIGLSYYPWWHGTLEQFRANVNDLAQTYGKDIVVVETAYPWTLKWFDATSNLVGMPSQLLSGYPATADGQRQFLSDVRTVISQVPFGKGAGFVYWEPAWISVSGVGSPWENCALFDSSGNELSSLDAFLAGSNSVHSTGELPNSARLDQNYPNPFNPQTVIGYWLVVGGEVSLRVYDLLGREVSVLVNEEKMPGTHTAIWNTEGMASGIYICQLRAGENVFRKKMIFLR